MVIFVFTRRKSASQNRSNCIAPHVAKLNDATFAVSILMNSISHRCCAPRLTLPFFHHGSLSDVRELYDRFENVLFDP